LAFLFVYINLTSNPIIFPSRRPTIPPFRTHSCLKHAPAPRPNPNLRPSLSSNHLAPLCEYITHQSGSEAVHLPKPSAHHIPPSPHHFLIANQLPLQRPHFFPTCQMAHQAGPAHFQPAFDSALRAYQENTDITLAEHPLAVQLRSCDSAESIITILLQGEPPAFSNFQEKDRITKSIKTIVSVLATLSASTSLGDALDLVRQTALITLPYPSLFLQKIPPAKALLAALAILLDVCAILRFMCRYLCDIQVNQAARSVTSSWDPLVELLESIENFLNRLDIYTRIPPTMDKMVIKIMAELLSTLALTTRELKQGRPSESVLADLLPYSPQRSQIRKERLRREGRRGDPAEAGPTHARRGSNYGSSVT
jgi:hypothetical protein